MDHIAIVLRQQFYIDIMSPKAFNQDISQERRQYRSKEAISCQTHLGADTEVKCGIKLTNVHSRVKLARSPVPL